MSNKRTALITGASNGLGSMIHGRLLRDDWSLLRDDWIVYNWSQATNVDVSNREDIQDALERVPIERLDVLINCAGVNAIDYLPDLHEDVWDQVMNTNAKGIYLVTQALLEALRGGTVLNIISNASHVPMTSSLAYNASKGAAAIMTKQMARELKKTHDITVFGVSPNKLHGTFMSSYIESRVMELRGWTEEQARAYQLASLPAGEETDPDTLAEFITFLLSTKRRHKYLAGCILDYGGP